MERYSLSACINVWWFLSIGGGGGEDPLEWASAHLSERHCSDPAAHLQCSTHHAWLHHTDTHAHTRAQSCHTHTRRSHGHRLEQLLLCECRSIYSVYYCVWEKEKWNKPHCLWYIRHLKDNVCLNTRGKKFTFHLKRFSHDNFSEILWAKKVRCQLSIV